MKVQDDARAARAGGAGRIRTYRQRAAAIARAPAARRQADHLRQWRLGHRRQRLGHRLRAAAGGFKPVPAVSLALEPANITAVANDVGTDAIFLRQLIAQARPEDVAVAISTSGGSHNIIMALEEARKRKLLTVALLGYDGGEIQRRGLADFSLVVHSRLYSAHSGSAGFDLPRDSRIVGGVGPWPSLNSIGTARCPHTTEMRD